MAKKKVTTTVTTTTVETDETATSTVQRDYILLDRSGSMDTKWHETLSSINAYVKGLAKDKINTLVSLAVFDHHGGMFYDIIRDGVPPSTWHNVTPTEVEPRGSTPLFDAVARTVQQAKRDNPEKAAIIIMTDGYENCSREIDATHANALLDDCRAKGWSVVFLGADFNAFSQGVSLGASLGSTLSMSTGNYGKAFTILNSTRAMYSCGEAATMEFTEDEQRIAMGNKPLTK